MNIFNPEIAKVEYNKAKATPHELCLITAQVIDGVIQQFKFGAQDFTFESGETKIFPVRGNTLLQENWPNVQLSIQAVLDNTHGRRTKAA